MVEIKLPELGEEITKATVSFWYCKVGDSVKEGDDIVELTTDKATFNVSATADGVVKDILVKQGSEARVGDTLATVS